MDLLTLLGVVALAGGVGGAFNGWHINFFRSGLDASDPVLEQVASDVKAILTQAIETPKREKWGSFAFNVAAGALAAAISWSAYGPYSLENIFGGAASDYGLTLTALATAVITGFGGTRWLTNERDKALLKQAAENTSVESSEKGAELASALIPNADPGQAVRLTKAIKRMSL